jgi:hypothetical protein
MCPSSFKVQDKVIPNFVLISADARMLIYVTYLIFIIKYINNKNQIIYSLLTMWALSWVIKLIALNSTYKKNID